MSVFRFLVFASACALQACTGCGSQESPETARVVVLTDRAVANISPSFLSFAVDSAQVVGGHFWDPEGTVGSEGAEKLAPYDFTRPTLRNLARALTPAYLRIGGTAADRVFYDLDASTTEPPDGYESVLTGAMWADIVDFARATGVELFFTLNAGPGPRTDGVWDGNNARTLIARAAEDAAPVYSWELGNEVHGFPLFHQITVTPEDFAKDVETAKSLIGELTPDAKLAAPSSAYWPTIGEVVPFLERFLMAGGGAHLDILSWHYYPQQSRRCPITPVRAESGLLLQGDRLGEVDIMRAGIEDLRDTHAPGLTLWLGETGNAQCGGEPGVSDAFEGGFWWLDQLGRVARAGHQVSVRQTLSGSNYGLINDTTLAPNPDYWNSLLWKRLMGTRVLDATAVGEGITAYAHCTPAEDGSVALLVLNLTSETRRVETGLERPLKLYLVTADQLSSKTIEINGARPPLADDGTPGEFAPVSADSAFSLPPHSYAFAISRINATACQN